MSHGKETHEYTRRTLPESILHAALWCPPLAWGSGPVPRQRSAAAQTCSLTPLPGPRSKTGAAGVLPLTYVASGRGAASVTISPGPAPSSLSASVPWACSSPREASPVRGARDPAPRASSRGGLGRSPAHLDGWPPRCCLLVTPNLGTARLATRQGSGSPASFLSTFAMNGR